jgi:hypothetical protein
MKNKFAYIAVERASYTEFVTAAPAIRHPSHPAFGQSRMMLSFRRFG